MSDLAMQALRPTPAIAGLTDGLRDGEGPAAAPTPPAMVTWLSVGTALSLVAVGCLWMASAST